MCLLYPPFFSLCPGARSFRLTQRLALRCCSSESSHAFMPANTPNQFHSTTQPDFFPVQFIVFFLIAPTGVYAAAVLEHCPKSAPAVVVHWRHRLTRHARTFVETRCRRVSRPSPRPSPVYFCRQNFFAFPLFS